MAGKKIIKHTISSRAQQPPDAIFKIQDRNEEKQIVFSDFFRISIICDGEGFYVLHKISILCHSAEIQMFNTDG